MDTTIGNYSDVIRGYEKCGLSRIALQTESDCFEYNRDFGSNLMRLQEFGALGGTMVRYCWFRRMNFGLFTM